MADRKIKLLYITRKYPPAVGGMENFAYNLYNGFDPDIVDKKIIKLGGRQSNLLWFFPYAFFRTLFTARKYDVILVGDAVLSAIGSAAKRVSPRTTVAVNVFGLDITYSNKLYQWYLRRFYNRFDKYISISQDTDDQLHKRGDYDSCIITPGVEVTGEFIDKDSRVFRDRYGIGADQLMLITVGRLVKRKGVEWFIRNVLPRLTDVDYRYVVIGQGEEEKHIKEAIEETGLGGKVIMTGRVDSDSLENAYTEADIFVMPNIRVEGNMEGFGIVASEASAHEDIVIASSIEGIRDAIKNGCNGILVDSRDAGAFERAIRDVDGRRDEYREKAREFSSYTRNNYSWNGICKQYVELFVNMRRADDGQKG